MHHAEFELVSLREFDLITRARRKAMDARADAWRVMNQELATLVKFAFHDPKKMPDLTKAGRRGAKPEHARKEGLAQLRAAFIGMHFQSIKEQ